MDLTLSPADAAFRDQVRAFLVDHLTDEIKAANRAASTVFVEKDTALAWQRILNDKGWLAYGWPVEYGGTGWTAAQRYIFERECALAGAPTLIPMGLKFVGPVIFTFGTDDQKATYLPRILSGEDYWCQGYSEPGAGSDLAALQCKAVRDGDDYVVNGTKIWTTHAHYATMMFCLVRTARLERRQQGITFLLIDMATPGITVEPIVTMAGEHEVNQVFFDDVRVPVANRVGEENDGWTYAKFLLEFERGGGSFSGGIRCRLDDLKLIARAEPDGRGGAVADQPVFADALARAEAELMALEMTEMRVLSSLSAGQNPGAMSSLIKTVATELEQRLNSLCIQALGYNALPFASSGARYGDNSDELPVPEHAWPAMRTHLNGRAASIFGGANEVQRDIIARMVLG